MRRQEADQIRTSLNTLEQAIGILQEYENRQHELLELLAQMQQMAISIGTEIEECEGEGLRIVSKLEELCEQFYQIGVKGNCREQAQKAKEIIGEIKDSMEKEISIKKEVVFLPYQVSMWDSLESIWEEACKDEAVNCRVIPIPYYDVNKDNSLGEMHYESDKFPPNVPITSYEKYDLAVHHPDVIFFHNPYDGLNHVTRIPENYYSIHLKPCTDLLVYIPYFVSEKGGPSDHQCSMPGVLCADKVAVQEGEIFEKYVRLHDEALEENGWKGKLVASKDKFMPLGSPKFDKLTNAHFALEDLPVEWQKKIRKSDGTRKKIIYYNSTISTALHDTEGFFRRMKEFFSVFQECEGEAVLLWRLHPLLLKTFRRLRENAEEELLELLLEFREAEWGILDETPDPTMGLSISDAYYGTHDSSILTVYRKLDRPMLFETDDLEEIRSFIESVDYATDCHEKTRCGANIYKEIQKVMEG